MRIMTIGTFDLFHYGHINLLRAILDLDCGPFHVGVNTTEYVLRKGKPLPVMTTMQRTATLDSLADLLRRQTNHVPYYVFQYNGEDIIKVMDDVNCNTLVVGSDWAAKDYWAQIECASWRFFDCGFKLLYLPYTATISTTQLREACQLSRP